MYNCLANTKVSNLYLEKEKQQTKGLAVFCLWGILLFRKKVLVLFDIMRVPCHIGEFRMTDFAGVTIFACQQDMSGEGGGWIYIPTPPTMIDVRFIIKVYSKGTSPMSGGVSISGQIIFSDDILRRNERSSCRG